MTVRKPPVETAVRLDRNAWCNDCDELSINEDDPKAKNKSADHAKKTGHNVEFNGSEIIYYNPTGLQRRRK